MSALKFIQTMGRRIAAKKAKTPQGITQIQPSIYAEAEASGIVQKLVDSGLPIERFDEFIKSEKDVIKYLNLIDNSDPLRKVISADSPEGRAITEKLFGKRGAVVDMAGKKIDTSQGIMGGKSVKELMESGQVKKGTKGLKVSGKVKDREMFENANKRLNKTDVEGIIKNIKKLSPMDAMKEANLVIGRKNYYKNLTPEESKKILQDTEDHIFERDIPIDPEDMADGGVAGLLGERPGYQIGGSPAIDARMQNTRAQNIKNIGDLRLQNTRAQNIATNEAQRANNLRMRNMRGMGKSGFQTQPGTLNQGIENVGNQLGVDTSGIQSGVDRVQNIIMNQAPNRFADYLSGRTEPVTDLSEIASTQSTRDIINQGILGSLERNQITNPTGSFNTVVQSKGGGGEYASNRPVDYSGYKLGNPLPGIKNYAAEVGQVLNTMGGNAENQIANTLGDYSFEYRPPSYDFDDDYMGIKDIYDFKGKSGEGGGTPYDVNVELTDADTKQKIREQLFKDAAAEPSAMPQGSPGQLNPTLTSNEKFNGIGAGKLNPDGSLVQVGTNESGFPQWMELDEAKAIGVTPANQKPTMADVAGPKEGYISLKEYEDMQRNLMYDFMKSPGNRNRPKEEIEQNIKNIVAAASKDPDNYLRNYMGNFDSIIANRLASGGPARQNFAMGKRAFLKLMGGVGAGIAGLKSGLLGLGKGGAKKAVSETVKQSAGSGTPPPYFFKLVEKIKTLGDDAPKLAVKDREVVTKYKDYTLTEDITTGEKTIQRMKVDDDLKYDASEYYGKPVGEEVYMNYKPGKGQIDETTKGKTPPDEYTEDTSLIRSDKPVEGEVMDTFDGVPDDVLKEVEAGSGNVPESFYTGPNPIKKADGGLAAMLGE